MEIEAAVDLTRRLVGLKTRGGSVVGYSTQVRHFLIFREEGEGELERAAA